MKILPVEDEPTHAKLAAAVLSTAGAAVRHVTRAARALEEARHLQPDVILLDLQLPDLDGLELLRRLKIDGRTRGIAVEACTAYTNLYSEWELRAAGCAAFLLKPLDTRRLSAEVRAAAGTKA